MDLSGLVLRVQGLIETGGKAWDNSQRKGSQPKFEVPHKVSPLS